MNNIQQRQDYLIDVWGYDYELDQLTKQELDNEFDALNECQNIDIYQNCNNYMRGA